MQAPMNLDLSKTTPILTPNGNKIWAQGFILRKVSKFVTGTPDDNVLPIQVFYDPETGEILKEGLPAELKYLIEESEK